MKKFALLLALLLLTTVGARAEIVTQSSSGGGGGGSVSVTAGEPSTVVTPSPGTGTFTIGNNLSLANSSTGSLPVANGGYGNSISYPCDILATAGTPCIAAHSMTRKMFSAYAGNLFQVERASDSTTQNIGTLSNGTVDVPTLQTFCAATTCKVSELYDQANNPSSGNNLPQATFGNMPGIIWGTAWFGPVPILNATLGTYLRNRASTVNMPTGGSTPTTEYMVAMPSQFSTCCGTYGNMEATVANTGSGHMFALAVATGTEGNSGIGSGPWAGVDWENGVYFYGNTLVGGPQTILSKYNPTGPVWTLEGAAGQQSLVTLHSGSLPPSYSAHFEGGLSLGEGGDGSPGPVQFMEGAITATVTTSGTDALLQASIQNFYNNFFVNTSSPSVSVATDLNAPIQTFSTYTTGTGTQQAILATNPNLTAGENEEIELYKAGGYYNAAEFGYHYAGNSSANNYLYFGMPGNSGVLVVSGPGSVSIDNTNNISAMLNIGGTYNNQSWPAWGVNGAVIAETMGTLTDSSTSAGATVTNNMANAFAQPTLAASNATSGSHVTYTNSATVYIANAPTAGSNVNLTNPYALDVAAGTTLLGGGVTMSGLSSGTVAANSYIGLNSSNQLVLGSGGGGSGTVTSVSVATANGFSGTVANPTTTPAITIIAGAITPTTVNGLTISTSTGTVTIANAKTLTANNTLTLAGTDSTTLTFPSTSATIARTDAGQTFTGTQAFGALTATTLNGNTFTSGTGVLTIAAGKTLTDSNTLTLAGTDGTTMTFPGTTATIARTDAGQTFTGTQTMASPVVGTQTAGNNSTTAASTAYVDRGASGASWVLVSCQTASTSASLTWTSIPNSSYTHFVMTLDQIVPVTNASNLVLQASANNGVGYTVSGYNNTAFTIFGTTTGTPTPNTTGFDLAGAAVDNTAAIGVMGMVQLGNLPNNSYLTMRSEVYALSGGEDKAIMAAGRLSTTLGPVNALKLLFSSGNISTGTACLYGIRNS